MINKQHIFIFFTVFSCAAIIFISGRMTGFDFFRLPLQFRTLISQTKPSLLPTDIFVKPGDNIQVGNLQVHILSAVRYENVPQKNGFNLFLNGWARHKSNMAFKCCLVRLLPNGEVDKDNMVEIATSIYHIYTQWIVDMQKAEFTCALPEDQFKTAGNSNMTHVAFAETSCVNATEKVMEILYPKRVEQSVVACLKIAYGSINQTKAVEWFEYQKLMGVNRVFAYTFDLHPPVKKVFEYYQSIGFLEAWPIRLPTSKDGKERSPANKRNTSLEHEQAWVDEVVAANDCKHRFNGHDYVMVFDIDEFIIPKDDKKTYFDILKSTQDKYPNAGAFSFDAHIAVLSWEPTRPDAPLFITHYTNHTGKANYDGADRNTRWAHIPHRTYYVKNNQVIPKEPYTTVSVPNNFFTLLHFRICKPQWKNCNATPPVRDDGLVAYERKIVENILSGVIESGALKNSTSYIDRLKAWSVDEYKKEEGGR